MGAKRVPGAAEAGKALGAVVFGLERARLRHLLEKMREINEAGAAIAATIEALAEALPDERRQRRDAAIYGLAQTFDGTRWAVAGAVAKEIRRYAASVWKRRDVRLERAPLEYGGNPRKLALFAIMREGGAGAVIGRRQIADVLAKLGISASTSEDVESKPPESEDDSPHGNRQLVPTSNPFGY